MPRIVRSFILMITFLTRIPVPMNFEFNNDDFVKGFPFFPVIGFLVGSFISLPFLIQDRMPDTIFPLIVIVIYLLVVGGLHIDGVSDVFDGIFSARTRDRMIEIMEDSRVGAFGVIGLIIYFMGLYIGLFEVAKLELGWLYVLVMPVVGRTMALIGSGISKYAKKEGLGKSLVDGTKPVVSFIAVMLLCVGAYLININVFISVAVTVVIVFMIIWRIHIILGGITGDVVGMLVEISQVVFLLTLAIVN